VEIGGAANTRHHPFWKIWRVAVGRLHAGMRL